MYSRMYAYMVEYSAALSMNTDCSGCGFDPLGAGVALRVPFNVVWVHWVAPNPVPSRLNS